MTKLQMIKRTQELGANEEQARNIVGQLCEALKNAKATQKSVGDITNLRLEDDGYFSITYDYLGGLESYL